jgi:hypothetical protein
MQRQIHEGVSCAPRDLYTREEWHDPHITFERIREVSDPARSEFGILQPVFARHAVARPMPASVAGPSPADIDVLLSHYADINSRYASSSPSSLVRIREAVVWRNMIFLQSGDDLIPLYENFRIIDRQEKGGDVADKLRSRTNIQELDSGGAAVIFYGSVGSFNYGHWLVDDFTRYAALERVDRPLLCLFSRLNDAIDRVRQEGVTLAAGSRACESRFVDPEIPVRVKDLLYVTPCSVHPFLKNPDALAFVRDLGRRTVASATPGRRLFVNRADHWPRRLTNIADLSPILSEHGFVELVTDGLSLREQIDAFAQAEIVAGIMGASMTSTVFCPPGTPLLYLAPSGWNEPFFWDQAAMCSQPYHVMFGTPDENDPHSLYQKSFSVDPQHLSSVLRALTAGAPAPRAGLPGA